MRACSTGTWGPKNLPVFLSCKIFAVICLLFTANSVSAQEHTPSSGGSTPESERAAQLRALNNSVLQLHRQLQEDQSGAAGIRAQAAAVLTQRAAKLAALIEGDPRAALSFAFSPELLADLAAKFPDSAYQLESHTTLSGPIEHWIFDNADHKSSRSQFKMKVGQQTFNLYFVGQEQPNLKGGYTFRATGVLLGQSMAVETSNSVPSNAALGLTSLPNSATLLVAASSLRERDWPVFALLGAFVLGLLGRLGVGQIRRFAACAVAIAIFAFNPGFTFAQTSSCNTIGVQNTAVLLVNFQDVAIAVTSQQVNAIFFDTSTGHSLNGYWQEASYGQTSATGSVFGPYTIAASSSYSCLNLEQVFDDAVAAASAAGVNLQNYTRINLVFPGLSCGWSGVTAVGSAGAGCSTWNTPSGTLTASLSYLVSSSLSTRDQGVELVAHEDGHQLGLGHSGTINDSPQTLGPVSNPGTVGEFNDFFSVMGASTLGLYPAQQKAEILKWMASGPNYQVVQSSGTYFLQPLEVSPAGLQALKIQRGTGNAGDYLWIEYRQPIGNYDSTIGFMNFSGALVHYEDATTSAWGHTHVLDFTPSDVGSWYNTALAPGQSWTDPYSNVSISVLSATSGGLTVSVSYGTVPCTSSVPSVTVSPPDPSIYPGQSANYTVSVTNNDSSGCPSSTINLGSTEPSGWSTTLSSSAVTLSPGQSASVTLGKDAPAGTPPGTYPVNLSASASASSASATANATVRTPPSLAVNVSVAGASFTRPSTIPITASVTNGGTPTSGASVTFTLTAPNGSTTTQTASTGSNGAATWNDKLNSRSLVGTYSVTAQAALSSGSKKAASTQTATSNSITFEVQ
jgi:M6 family metalloprotease-like protein